MADYKEATLNAMKEIISSSGQEDPFYIMNEEVLMEQVRRWSASLPSVKPFYAVKCNPNGRLLNLLATRTDFGFDCASIGEISTALEAGATADNIIYCNPCKQQNHLADICGLGIRIMSFDNHDELVKLTTKCSEARLLLRILVDDSDSVCRLGSKFGADEQLARELLQEAKLLGANVCGISFHVGSNCASPAAYANAIVDAKRLLDAATSLGFTMEILDIGGGFPAGPLFEKIAEEVNKSLEGLKKDYPEISVIAEPGRFIAEPVFTLAAQVISKKVDHGIHMYYINEGVYGSFGDVLLDYASFIPIPLLGKPGSDNTFRSCVWGPTCDSIDCVVKACDLPLLETGDWVYFENMGAYTMATASGFNGFEAPKIFFVRSQTILV